MNALQWRDRDGNFHRLDEMSDSYLYNTAKMLWNNVISPFDPFGDVIKWSFNPENYPMAYLYNIFNFGLMELKKRNFKDAEEFLKHIGVKE